MTRPGVFNPFVWDLYRESSRGRQTLAFFTGLEQRMTHPSLFDPYFGYLFCQPNIEVDQLDLPTDYFALFEATRQFAETRPVRNIQEATGLYHDLLVSGIGFPDFDEIDATRDRSVDIIDGIHAVSLALHSAHPTFFLPYSFVSDFITLQNISDVFSLALPPLPGKQDLSTRKLYYGQLNQAFYDFRTTYDLTPEEMCAFLYDFAPAYLETVDKLPDASRVWLLTGGRDNNGDLEYLEAAVHDPQSTTFWQGNLGTQPGDILLMYVVSPYSMIHSVWRATSPGYIDPFFHFHSTVQIGQPIKTKPVTFREMKAHPLLSKVGAIRANLQGPSGKLLTPEAYDAVLEIMALKGQDLCNLPRPKTIAYLPEVALVNERDVETQLIEPLLAHLGYSPDMWTRQYQLRMGRGERHYPDYVIGPHQTHDDERADVVLEAKFSVAGGRDLDEAFRQGASYAYRLRAKNLIVAAREGVWVYTLANGAFERNKAVQFGWEALQQAKVLLKLRKLLPP